MEFLLLVVVTIVSIISCMLLVVPVVVQFLIFYGVANIQVVDKVERALILLFAAT